MNHHPLQHHHWQDKTRSPNKALQGGLSRLLAFSQSPRLLFSQSPQKQHQQQHHQQPRGKKSWIVVFLLLITIATALVVVGRMGLMVLHGQRDLFLWSVHQSVRSSSSQNGSPHLFTEEQAEQNAALAQKRRQAMDSQCRKKNKKNIINNKNNNKSPSELLVLDPPWWHRELDRALSLGRKKSSSSSPTTKDVGIIDKKNANTTTTTENNHEDNDGTAGSAKCPFVFFDFGANIGDSLGKFISAGLPTSCDGGGTGANANTNATTHTNTKNRLVEWAASRMAETGKLSGGRKLHPEHYCYFGIEGNPVFTDRLELLGDGMMRTRPRPVRLAHFYTETVASEHDGPAVLYLDTKNEANNYWGSSLLYTHKDVQASANEQGQVYQAQVRGVTLTTLLRQHLVMRHGSHAMIKMDIEGAEYELLNEAYDSGILCELSSNAIFVDLLVEVHSRQVIGPLAAMERFRKEVRTKLEQECGVTLLLTLEADLTTLN